MRTKLLTMFATLAMLVTGSANAQSFYWYVGQENPVGIDTDNLKAATNEAGWHLIGESIDEFTLTFNNDNLIEFEEKKQYYLVIPEGLDVLAADGVTLHRTLIEIPSNIENHKVYQSKGETYDVKGVVIKSNVTKYYWYVGQEDPTNNSTITSTTGAEGWRLIYQPNSVTKNNPLFDTTDSDEEAIVGTKAANWYIAFPADKSYRIFDSDHEDQITVGNFYEYSNITFNDVDYVVYKGYGTARKWWGYTIYSSEVTKSYWWYVGTSIPTELNGAVANAETDRWTKIGNEIPSYIRVVTATDYNFPTWYVLMPMFGFKPHDATGIDDESSLWETSESPIGGYVLYTIKDAASEIQSVFKKLGTLPYNADSDYWYLGQSDPSVMTEISPISVYNWASASDSWEEIIDSSKEIELNKTPADWDFESSTALWYVAMPASSGYTPQDADLWETSTATIAGKDYIVYKSEGKVWELNTAFLPEGYVEEEPVEPEPYVTEFEANGIHYIFLENIVANEGLAAWVTSTNGWLKGDESTYSGDIVIPTTVTYGGKEYPVMGICEEAFKKSTINSLTLSEGVVYISSGAFKETHIGALYLPSTLRMWDNFFTNEVNGYMLLDGCLGLETLVVSSEHPLYDSRDNCNAIIETATNTLIEGCKGTVIPSSVTTIGPTAFIGRDIVEFVIPEGVKEVNGRVFERCKNLQSVVFPTSVEVIKGNMLFQSCSSLTSVEIPQTTLIRSAEDYEDPFETPGAMVIPSGMFSECSSLKEFTIPENVTSIGSSAFFMCGNLEAITIPESVIAVGDLAFFDCNKMTEVTLLGQTPSAVPVDAFNETQYEQITLNVPEGAEEAYKQHEVWGKFFKEEEPEPSVASGEYYLYHAESKRFLSRGEYWGTCATVDRYGIPFVWTAEEYSLKFLDSNVYLFETDDSNIYTDNASTGFTFEEVEGGYLLKSQKSDRYLTIGNAAITHDIVNVTDDASAAVVWQLKSKAEHDAIVAGYVEENYADVIKAAGLTATTGGFVSYLSTLTATDMTSAIGTARFAGSAGDWTFTEVRHQDWQPAYGTDYCELWQATGSYTQTLTGLAEGIYKVTVQGFERSGGWATCNTLAEKGYEISTATLSANGEETNLKSWYSGKTDSNNPDNTGQAVAKFNEGKYMNEVYTYVGADGTLTLTVCKPSHVGGNWIVFNNFTLTRYAEDGTGVGQLTIDNGQWTIYDLQGRKVENPAKGIYIINGRKVVIK